MFRDQFVVKENTVFDDGWNETFVVDLEKRECTCLSFQQNKFPCIHAIAVLHTREQFGSVFSYVDDCYKRRTVSQTCRKIPEETWNALEFDCDRDYDAVEDISGCEEDDVQWLQVDTTKRAHFEGEWSLICDSVEGDEATPLEKRVAGVVACILSFVQNHFISENRFIAVMPETPYVRVDTNLKLRVHLR